VLDMTRHITFAFFLLSPVRSFASKAPTNRALSALRLALDTSPD
jgi:hypothetical protein